MTANDDFDMPDLTDEMLNEFQQLKNVDLHLGVPEVKTVDKDWWVKKYGPKPPGPEIMALDVLVATLASMCFWLTITVWRWVFMS